MHLCWICGRRDADGAETLPGMPASTGLVCRECHETRVRSYAAAWQRLSTHLQANWRDISKRGQFDLSRVFADGTAVRALEVHLHFVELLGCQLRRQQLRVDLEPFAAALRNTTPHPEVTLLIADATVRSGRLVSHASEVSVLRRDDEVYSALWTHLQHPLAVKICYLKRGAPVREPEGFPWHPSRQRKIVKLSPYKGDTQPLIARRDLQI